jgi:beta-1,4-N-acetylglucosaminyltransferase
MMNIGEYSKKNMLRKNSVLCVVCSAGGHLSEAQLSVKGVYYPIYYVTYRLPHTEQSLTKFEHYFITNPHKSPWKYVINIFQSLKLYLRKRPKFILSTGSGMAIATCLIGRFFGSRVIFVETGARVHTPSMTGRLLYHFADLFIVQWEPLLDHYPRACFCGLLF